MRSLQNSHIQGIKLWGVHHAYTIAFLFLLCSFFGYSIGRIYGFTIHPDEFGYWFHAAVMAGYDWSGIASLNSYYSYGYSIILFPVFLLFQDGVMAYRAAVAVNFVILAGTGLLLQYLIKKLFPDRKGQLWAVFSAVAALYPPLLLYTKTTMTETMLVFLYVLITVLLYQYLEHRKTFLLIFLMAALVYIHFVHMRTVSLMAAGALCILFDRLFFTEDREKNRYGRTSLMYGFIVAAAVVLFVLGMSVKGVVYDRVYGGDSEIFQVNDYWGQLGKIQYIMTLEGLGNLVVSVSGKILYLGLATFGTAFWGLWHAWKAVIYGKERGKRVFWCFILLSAAGALIVCAVYTVYPGRVDGLVYGRYHEYVFPVLILAGLCEMWHAHRLWRGMLWNAGMELCMLIPVLCSLRKYHQTSLHACMIFGMSYLYGEGDFEPAKFYLAAYGFGILLMLFVTAVIAISRKKEGHMFVLFLIAVMEILLAIRASAMVTDTGSIGTYRDSVVADRIAGLMEDTANGETQSPRKVLYLHSGGDSNIGTIQFLLRDTQITVLDKRENIDDYRESEMGIWDLVLIDYEDDYGGELARRYGYTLSCGHFILYYNRISTQDREAGL